MIIKYLHSFCVVCITIYNTYYIQIIITYVCDFYSNFSSKLLVFVINF